MTGTRSFPSTFQKTRREGASHKALPALLALLKEQGVRTAYGVVTMPNDASAALHRKLGFGLLGTYHNTGYKNGRWRDVVWFEKHIGSFDGVPGADPPHRPARRPRSGLQDDLGKTASCSAQGLFFAGLLSAVTASPDRLPAFAAADGAGAG